MKNLKIASKVLSGALLIILIFVAAGFSQIQVSLPDTIGTPGDTITVPLTVSELPDSIYSYQFTLIFDSTVIRYLDYDISQTISAQWEPLQPLINKKTAGRLLLGDYGLQALSGSGILIKLKFAAVGSHLDSTIIHFDDFAFNSGNPASLSSDGKIKLLAPLIVVHFKANVSDSVQIEIDHIQQILPFDTLWYAGTEHTIAAAKEQIFSSDTKYLFEKWSDGGDTTHVVNAESDTTFQCDFLTYFFVSVQSEFGAPKGEGWYLDGSEALVSVDSLIAFGDTTRAIFLSWDGTHIGGEATFSFAVAEPTIETANWQLQHFLTIISDYGNPSGSGWYNAADSAYFSVSAVDSMSSMERFAFVSWQGSGVGSYSGSDFASMVVMNNSITETADWRQEFYLQIVTQPDSLVQFAEIGWHEADTDVEIFAPNNLFWENKIKYQFDHWALEGNSSAENPITVNMDSAHFLQAIYHADSVLVTISGNFSDLPVYVDGVQFSLPYQNFWQFESEHEIGVDSMVTNQDSVSRFIFEAWNDAGARFHKLRADSVLNLAADFKRQFYLSVATEPPDLRQFSEIGWYDEGDTVAVSEAPEFILQNNDTLRFENWVVDEIPAAGNPISVLMDSAHSLIAQYNFWLTISGLISDTKGNPVCDVFVRLSGEKADSTRSNENGFFRFFELGAGNYFVTPEAEWAVFDPKQLEIALTNYSVGDLNFVANDTISPAAEVIYPNGGENLYAGDEDTLRWAASDNREVDSLSFALSLDGGGTWETFAALDVQFKDSTGMFLWHVPDTSTDEGLMRVAAIDGDGNKFVDVSDGKFQISRHSEVENPLREKVPAQFQLRQNYPNPFNNSTVIPFQLAKSDRVVVEIFNFRGQRVARIFEGILKAGSHEVRWNGCDDKGIVLGSGIYFYQIKTSRGKKAANKLLLLK